MPEAAAVTPADLPVSRWRREWRRGAGTGCLPSRREGERERWRDGKREAWRVGWGDGESKAWGKRWRER